MKKSKKLISIFLAVFMILSIAPLNGFVGLDWSFKAKAATVDDLSYSIFNGEATITGCDISASGELVIPDTLDGCPVIGIGGNAFSFCYSLTSITIPDSVTSIGEEAFLMCVGLTSITIPDSVTSIGEAAFSRCNSLMSITIPDSVTNIGDYTFNSCTGLTSITIPDSVTSIGEWAFSGCKALNSVTIGNSVTTIGYSAFFDCPALTSITIPARVTSIGESNFGFYAYFDSDNNCYYTLKIEGFTIYGYDDSAAETYATNNDFTFVSLGKFKNDSTTDIYVYYDDNTFDDDIEFNANEVTEGAAFDVLNSENNKFKLFDITATNDSAAVEPNGTVTVEIPLPDDYPTDRATIYHVSSDDTREKVDSRIEGGYIVFEATRFGSYAIVDEIPTTDEPTDTDYGSKAANIVNTILEFILFIINRIKSIFGA